MSCYSMVPMSQTVYRINENDRFGEQPIIYLLVGGAKSILIDTGCRSGDLKAFIKEKMGDKLGELIVVNTHNHYDHVAGNCLFENNAIYASSRDERFTNDRFNTMGWLVGCRVRPYKISHWLGHIEKLHLGENESENFVQTLHAPGHTPDSMCLWYPRDNRLFVGDFVYRYGSILCAAVGASSRDYEQSAKSLVDFVNEKENQSGKPVRLSCGHVDDDLDSDWLRKFCEFVQRINAGLERSSGWGLLASYSSHNGALNYTVRRCMGVDRFLKPILKLFFR